MLPGALCILLISNLYYSVLSQRLQAQLTVLSLFRESQNNYFQLFVLVKSIFFFHILYAPYVQTFNENSIITVLMTKLCNITFQMWRKFVELDCHCPSLSTQIWVGEVSLAIWILSISLYFYPHLVWCKNTFRISVVDVINKQHCFYKKIKGVIFVHFHLIIGISEQSMS